MRCEVRHQLRGGLKSAPAHCGVAARARGREAPQASLRPVAAPALSRRPRGGARASLQRICGPTAALRPRARRLRLAAGVATARFTDTGVSVYKRDEGEGTASGKRKCAAPPLRLPMPLRRPTPGFHIPNVERGSAGHSKRCAKKTPGRSAIEVRVPSPTLMIHLSYARRRHKIRSQEKDDTQHGTVPNQTPARRAGPQMTPRVLYSARPQICNR